MKLGEKIIIVIAILFVGFLFGLLIGTSFGWECASPNHAYIEDVNHDGISDVKVISKGEGTTILYGTKGSKKLRLKADILKMLEDEASKKYK